MTYAPDVFGGTRREVESLTATTEFQRFQLEAAYLTLTSNVVAAAVQEASLRGQIAATEEIIKIETQSLGILRKQLELGQVAGADVAAVEATLAQAQATLPPLQKQLAVQRDLLTALIGRLPSQEPAEKFELASLQLPQDLPVSLPSKLVEQRPDIQSAEAQLHAASALIGVAIAAQLPQFTLTANAGTVANQIGQLFITPGTAFWTVAGNVAQTIFDAGTLLHKKRAADAAFDQAAAMYRSTVITAFQNVADALHALQSDAETLKSGVRGGARRLQEPRDRAPPVAARRHRLSRAADCREHLSDGADRPGPGAGRPLCRYCRIVPGIGRRLVEPRGCRTGEDVGHRAHPLMSNPAAPP